MILNSNLVNHYSFLAVGIVKPDFWPIALMITGCVVILLAGVMLTALLIRALYRRHRRVLTVKKWLQIQNDGNIRSVFHLRPDVGSTAVTAVLLHEERPLAPAMLLAPVRTAPVPAPSAPKTDQKAVTVPETVQDNGGHLQQSAGKASAKKPGEAAKAAKQAKKEAMGAVAVGRKAGGIIGALGSLLPGDLGKSFKEQSTQIQTATQKASKAIEEPEEKKQRLEHIQKEMKGLSGKKTQTAAPAAQTVQSEQVRSTASAAASGQPAAVTTGQAAEQPLSAAEQPRWIQEKGTYQTPSLEPGQNMRIKLELSPLNIYRSVTVPLCLKSKQVDEIQPDPTRPAGSSEAWQQIPVPGLPVYKSVQSILVNVLITAVNAFWVILLIKWFIGVVL